MQCNIKVVHYYTPMTMVNIENLQFSYGRKYRPVFTDFSISLKPGCIYGLLGKNGTGKSTLLYIMCGLLQPQGGTVEVMGGNPRAHQPQIIGEIFLVPEEVELPAVRLRDYVKLNAPFYPRFSQEVLQQCLSDFELTDDLRLDQLSMGQRKKAFMSFALATQVRLILMDEPTNGLDIPSKSSFRKVVSSNMSEEQTIVISTHQVRDIDSLLDHIIIMDNSQVFLNASVAEITQQLAFEFRPMGASVDDALYAQPSLQGVAVVVPNDGTKDTPINLELLFNAFMLKKDLLQHLRA